MRFPQRLARINRYVTNPIQRMWAGWLPPFAIVEHVGRRSGKAYRTPVNAFYTSTGGTPGLAIPLAYGPDRDWLKNIRAAGGAQVRRRAKTFGVSNPRVVSKDEAAQQVDGAWKSVFGALPFEEVLLLDRTS